MKVEPTAADWSLAKSVYGEFSRKPGAQHIASEFALAYLSAVLNKVRPSTILEFGAGIGTITYFLLKHPVNVDHVTTTENNEFCLTQFAANIPGELKDRYDLVVDEMTLLPGEKSYDLIIVDNSVSSKGYAYLDDGMTCFVEGHRSTNRQEIEDELSGRGLQCDLVNYNRGFQLCSVVKRRSKRFNFTYPKLRFFKVPKGCWIGSVQAVEEPANRAAG